MSTRSSLFLTKDNEHCYSDCSSPHFDENKKHIGDEITLEVWKENIVEFYEGENGIDITFKPGTEIYSLIKLMDIEHPKPIEQPTRAELVRDLKIANKRIQELEERIYQFEK